MTAETELLLIIGGNAGGEKRESTAGRLATVTGADWQMLQARLVRGRGAGEAGRSGETPRAYIAFQTYSYS